jgi:hypothetical protein
LVNSAEATLGSAFHSGKAGQASEEAAGTSEKNSSRNLPDARRAEEAGMRGVPDAGATLAASEAKAAATLASVAAAGSSGASASGKLRDLSGKLRSSSGKLRDPSGRLRDPSGRLRRRSGKLRDRWGKLRRPSGKLRDRSGKLREASSSESPIASAGACPTSAKMDEHPAISPSRNTLQN